jgi:hypothetical protein
MIPSLTLANWLGGSATFVSLLIQRFPLIQT